MAPSQSQKNRNWLEAIFKGIFQSRICLKAFFEGIFLLQMYDEVLVTNNKTSMFHGNTLFVFLFGGSSQQVVQIFLLKSKYF